MRNTKVIKLCFLKYHPDEPFMNRLTCYISKHKVFHVELGFDDNIFFSIMQDTHASLRKRRLENPNYEFYNIQVTPQQYYKCLELCRYIAEKQVTFDDWGLYLVFVSKFISCYRENQDIENIRSTFCSKIITQILQQIDLEEVQHLRPECTSPSDLLEAVRGSSRSVIDSVRIHKKNSHLVPNFN